MPRLQNLADIVNELHEQLSSRVLMLISENERLENENSALRRQNEELESLLMLDEDKYLHDARR